MKRLQHVFQDEGRESGSGLLVVIFCFYKSFCNEPRRCLRRSKITVSTQVDGVEEEAPPPLAICLIQLSVIEIT